MPLLHSSAFPKASPFHCELPALQNVADSYINASLWVDRTKTGISSAKFPCLMCPKSFAFSSHLERHMLVHTGSRPFSCPHCPYKAGQRAVLKKHIHRIHVQHSTGSLGNDSI